MSSWSSGVTVLRGIRALPVALLVWLAPSSALADRVVLQIRGSRFEVGEPIQVQLTALSDRQDMPQSPRLSAPAGFNVRGPNVSTQSQVSIVNGQMTQSLGLQASWILQGRQPGRYRVGPAQVVMSGQRNQSNTIDIELVPASPGGAGARGGGARGGARGRNLPRAFDPFGMLDPADPSFPSFAFPGGIPGGLSGRFPGLFDEEPAVEEEIQNLPPFPPELKVATARDPVAFLRAEAKPLRAIVGEQITYRAYIYAKALELEEGPSTEPKTTDFLKHPILEMARGEPSYRIPLDGAVWRAKKVREVALFPIRTGRLTVGPMQMSIVSTDGRRAKTTERASAPIEVLVTEPPLDGRPTGYQLGDVGSYSLSAEVTPREARVGDSVSVVVRLEGTGNLPMRLKPPTQHGAEWLEPTVSSSIDAKAGRIGGSRRFSYLVRVSQPGKLVLGTMELPYWDPGAKAYRTASADLGTVDVQGTPASQSSPPGQPASDRPAPEDRLGNLGMPRLTLGEGAPSATHVADGTWFWALLFGAPLSVVGFRGVRRGSQWGLRWMQSRSSSLRSRRARAFEEARKAVQGADPGLAANCAERALFLGIEEATGLLARGLLRNELRERLLKLNVEASLTLQVVEVLEALDGVRFQGESAGTLGELVARAERVATELCRERRGGRTPS